MNSKLKGNAMKFPNMRRWHDEKLDKELIFARACRDNNDTQNLAWLMALEEENAYRANGRAAQNEMDAYQ